MGSASRSPRSGSMTQPLRSGSSDNIPRNSARGVGPNNNNNAGISNSSHHQQQRMRQQQQQQQREQRGQPQQQQRPKARSNLSASSHHTTTSDDSTTPDADQQIEALEAKLGRLFLKLKRCEEDGDYERASDIKFGAIPDVENKLKKLKTGGGGGGASGSGAPPPPA